jgi:gamma-glutamylcyclotransferase
MLPERLKLRVPSATVLGTAKLPGYTLTWHKAGNDGSGKCSILKTSELQDYVWGVLYEIDPTEKLNLDRIEGLGHGYDEILVQLEFNEKTIDTCTYIGTNINPFLKPFHWYKGFVILGAIQNKLPKRYIATLETAVSICDQNIKRQQENINIQKNALK